MTLSLHKRAVGVPIAEMREYAEMNTEMLALTWIKFLVAKHAARGDNCRCRHERSRGK